MRSQEDLKKLRDKLAEELKDDILERYYGWEYFNQDVIDEFLGEEIEKNGEITEAERKEILKVA